MKMEYELATDERYTKALRDDFLRVIEESRSEEKPPDIISFPNAEWDIFDGGSFTVIYRRPETREAVAKFFKRARDKRDWTAKWSSDYINRQLSIALSKTKGADPDAALVAFESFAHELDAEPPELDAIFVVGGLYLAQDELKIGGVRLFRVNDQELERLRRIFYKILATVTNPPEDKERLKAQADGFLDALANRTVAEVPTVGDRDRAKEQAAQIIEPTLDFLQLIVAIEEPSFKNIRITEGGDLLAQQPPRLFVSRDETEIHWDVKLAMGHRVRAYR